MVEDDFQLICFDIVSEPSTPGAYLKQDNNINIQGDEINLYLSEGKEKTKSAKINDIIDDILKG